MCPTPVDWSRIEAAQQAAVAAVRYLDDTLLGILLDHRGTCPEGALLRKLEYRVDAALSHLISAIQPPGTEEEPEATYLLGPDPSRQFPEVEGK
jgi:hypothetical protein